MMLRKTLVLLWIVIAAGTMLAGLSYYLTPIQERPFLDSHARFAPSGQVGLMYGIVGTLFMLAGVLSYSLRRRWKSLQHVGKLKHWLEIHIFLCTLGPFLVLLHSSFRVGNLVAIAFWSMTLVVASGLFGRYLYVRIPKTLNGTFHSLETVEQRRTETLSALSNRGSLHAMLAADEAHRAQLEKPRSSFHALVLSYRWEREQKKREAEIRNSLSRVVEGVPLKKEVVDLALEEAKLRRQIALVQPFRKLFHYWHVFHLPLAIVMFVILTVHVTVATLFGYGWVA
jgi:hypothetical protein